MKKSTLISISISIILFFCLLFLYFSFYSKRIIQENTVFTIDSGQSAKSIAYNLKQAGYIKNESLFLSYVKLKNLQNKFQAGRHKLDGEISLKDLAQILTKDALPQERDIRIIEGWTVEKIGEYLEKQRIVLKKEFLDTILSLRGATLSGAKWSDEAIPRTLQKQSYSAEEDGIASAFAEASADKSSFVFDWLRLISRNDNWLEGFLFPDTYRIYPDATAQEIIEKMLNNFDQKLSPDMRQEMERQDKTIYEVITMASIIEKEVQTAGDKKIVSDIFWKRIDNGVPLQADSTVNYVIKGKSPVLTLEQTQLDTPYNTYKYQGLPPGPISNPGLDSIKAAIYPEPNDYWYFLSKQPAGETVFSKTYEEHLRNKEQWLR